MPQPRVVTLSEVHVHSRPRGPAEFLPKDFSNVVKLADTMVWNPAVDGILWVRAVRMKPAFMAANAISTPTRFST